MTLDPAERESFEDALAACVEKRDRIIAARDKNPHLNHWKVPGQLETLDLQIGRLRDLLEINDRSPRPELDAHGAGASRGG